MSIVFDWTNWSMWGKNKKYRASGAFEYVSNLFYETREKIYMTPCGTLGQFYKSWNQNYAAFSIYLWRKVICLFCFVCTCEIHWTWMLQIALLVSLESSWGWEGCISLVSWCLDLRCKSSWILKDFFTEN